MTKYQHFDPRRMAELAHHYLTGMVDEKKGYLPYWLILPNQKPAEAAHCRVDDGANGEVNLKYQLDLQGHFAAMHELRIRFCPAGKA